MEKRIELLKELLKEHGLRNEQIKNSIDWITETGELEEYLQECEL